MKFHYGLDSLDAAKSIVKKVVHELGGSIFVYRQMLETSCAETKCGTYPDAHPETTGVGACQHDQINIDDIKLNGEQRHFDIIKEKFGYDILTIKLSDLSEDPLLSFICCRLSYKRIPEAIPGNLIDRALYWKKYYNTYAENAAGTPEHYLSSVKQMLGEDWE